MKGADHKNVEIRLVPLNKPNGVDRPIETDHYLSVPAVGVAYTIIPTVLSVAPKSPAEAAGIKQGDRIKTAQFVLPEGTKSDVFGAMPSAEFTPVFSPTDCAAAGPAHNRTHAATSTNFFISISLQ